MLCSKELSNPNTQPSLSPFPILWTSLLATAAGASQKWFPEKQFLSECSSTSHCSQVHLGPLNAVCLFCRERGYHV